MLEENQIANSSLIHQLRVISNFIIAFEGIDGSDTHEWVKRIQELIRFCTEEASSIRDSIFSNLEDSFLFCSEFVDVPIFNDEQ